mmetsp:Transcript_54367/g.101948  ORF Transcript_54367/g.101948 Transcript_54367/m.101948 type:complete len:302 (+) Transcript_54367:720-1625(+)
MQVLAGRVALGILGVARRRGATLSLAEGTHGPGFGTCHLHRCYHFSNSDTGHHSGHEEAGTVSSGNDGRRSDLRFAVHGSALLWLLWVWQLYPARCGAVYGLFASQLRPSIQCALAGLDWGGDTLGPPCHGNDGLDQHHPQHAAQCHVYLLFHPGFQALCLLCETWHVGQLGHASSRGHICGRHRPLCAAVYACLRLLLRSFRSCCLARLPFAFRRSSPPACRETSNMASGGLAWLHHDSQRVLHGGGPLRHNSGFFWDFRMKTCGSFHLPMSSRGQLYRPQMPKLPDAFCVQKRLKGRFG